MVGSYIGYTFNHSTCEQIVSSQDKERGGGGGGEWEEGVRIEVEEGLGWKVEVAYGHLPVFIDCPTTTTTTLSLITIATTTTTTTTFYHKKQLFFFVQHRGQG